MHPWVGRIEGPWCASRCVNAKLAALGRPQNIRMVTSGQISLPNPLPRKNRVPRTTCYHTTDCGRRYGTVPMHAYSIVSDTHPAAGWYSLVSILSILLLDKCKLIIVIVRVVWSLMHMITCSWICLGVFKLFLPHVSALCAPISPQVDVPAGHAVQSSSMVALPSG